MANNNLRFSDLIHKLKQEIRKQFRIQKKIKDIKIKLSTIYHLLNVLNKSYFLLLLLDKKSNLLLHEIYKLF